MKNLNCNVIKDLLPSYIDKISSDETNKIVEEHLSNCKDCYATFKSMNIAVDNELIDKQFEQIDYLKKYKKNKIITVIFAITLTLCIVLSVTMFYQYVFRNIALPIYLEDIKVSTHTATYSDNTPTFTFYFYSDKSTVLFKDDISYDENGDKVLYIKAYARFGLEKPSQTSYSIRLVDLKNDNISKIYLKDTIGELKELWSEDYD